MSKERISFENIEAFTLRQTRPDTNEELAKRVGEEAGFTKRHIQSEPVINSSFDARSLRRSNRTAQLGIAVRPEIKERFWKIAQDMGLQNGEEVLEFLLQFLEKNNKLSKNENR